jgi:acyl carrier protein
MSVVWYVVEYGGTVRIGAHHGDEFDEMLTLDGNFESDEQKRTRAQEICNQLNGGEIAVAADFQAKRYHQILEDKMIPRPINFEFLKQLLVQQWFLWENNKLYDPTEWAHITPTTPFAELGADSLDMVELLIIVEDEYDVEISDKDADRIKNPQDFVEILKKVTGRNA